MTQKRSKTRELTGYNEIVAHVLHELEICAALFANGDPKSQRTAASIAIAQIVGFAEAAIPELRRDDRAHLLLSVARLSRDLHELDHGRVGPMLTPAPRTGGAPSLAIDEAAFRATASAALTILYEARAQSLKGAAKYVADALSAQGYRMSRKTRGTRAAITGTAVINWRRRCIEGGPDDVDANQYRAFVASLPSRPAKLGHDAARELAASIIDTAIPKGFGHLREEVKGAALKA